MIYPSYSIPGDQISIVDLHLGPWLARIVTLCDGLPTDDGDTIVSKIEARIGDGFTLPKDFQTVVSPDLNTDPSLQITPGAKRVKLAVFWDEATRRASWNGTRRMAALSMTGDGVPSFLTGTTGPINQGAGPAPRGQTRLSRHIRPSRQDATGMMTEGSPRRARQ